MTDTPTVPPRHSRAWAAEPQYVILPRCVTNYLKMQPAHGRQAKMGVTAKKVSAVSQKRGANQTTHGITRKTHAATFLQCQNVALLAANYCLTRVRTQE